MRYFDYKQVDNGESSFPLEDFDVDEFLEETQSQEEKRLEQEIEQIFQQLEERDRIHEEALTELQSKLDWYIERLEELYFRGLEQGKQDLKERIKEFYREIRLEKKERWRDRQKLEKERRQLEKEISELDDIDISKLL